MPKLREVANIYSKTTGAYKLSIDIMFLDRESYEKIRDSGLLSPSLFARVYGVAEEDCLFVAFDPGMAMKCSFPRSIPAGHVGDWNLWGVAQGLPLEEIEVPD